MHLVIYTFLLLELNLSGAVNNPSSYCMQVKNKQCDLDGENMN